MKTITIFIPSAGLGERLRPITEHIPKPLLPILGKPILEIILEKVSKLPINKIGINLYHKREEIEERIKKSAFSYRIKTFAETEILGTGGALKNAEDFLKGQTFLVHNSDILSDIDLECLINHHLSSKNLITLAVHDYPEFNNVEINENGDFLGICGLNSKLKTLSPQSLSGDQNSKLIAFTGIAVYSPEFLRFLPEGVSSVVNVWLRAIKSGEVIGTFDVSGSYWRDIGTPQAYFNVLIDHLRDNGEGIYIHPSAKVKEDLWPDGWVVIEKECVIDKGVSLKNAILLPGTEIRADSNREDCIIGPGYSIKINGTRSAKTLIGIGGSDRNYYRIKKDNGSLVLMEARSNNPDFERHIEYSRFFKKYSIPVSELIEVNPDKKTALFEDLGDLSLYSWLRCPRNKKAIEEVYRHAIDILISIHSTLTSHVSECPLLKDRIFNYEHLRWETDYFIERFIKGIRNIKVKDISGLQDEFHRLALKVDSFPKTIIHRDFQSQNIMISKGGILRIVDYQGARIGPPAYDLISLLWDPYYRLEDGLSERLVDYYIQKITPFSSPLKLRGDRGGLRRGRGSYDSGGSEGRVKSPLPETLLPCSLQRHMQALGAYGFLSMVKGKKYFLKFVPEGLRLLKEDVSLAKNEYPELYRLVAGL